MNQPNALAVVKSYIESPQFKDELRKLLPKEGPGADPDRFQRVVMNAVMGNPELLQADRTSLFRAALMCAGDGLIPDGNEAALVVYSQNVAPYGQPKNYVKNVRYMPMVKGILKKVRNSGEIATLSAELVREGDEVDFENTPQGKKFRHKPKLFGQRGAVIGAYATALYRDGTFDVEFMDISELEAVKAASKASGSGPWAGAFQGEMMKKTVLRRLSKRLPMSTDAEGLIRRDDDMYDLRKASDEPQMLAGAASNKPAQEVENKRPAALAAVMASQAPQAQPEPISTQAEDVKAEQAFTASAIGDDDIL